MPKLKDPVHLFAPIIHHLPENTPPYQHAPPPRPQTLDRQQSNLNTKYPTNLFRTLSIRVHLTCHILIALQISDKSIRVCTQERAELIERAFLLPCKFGAAVHLDADCR
jgi:hypothetical protein